MLTQNHMRHVHAFACKYNRHIHNTVLSSVYSLLGQSHSCNPHFLALHLFALIPYNSQKTLEMALD